MRVFMPLLVLVAVAAPCRAQQTPAADSARVYDVHEVETLPRPMNGPEFTAAMRQGYPAHLRDAGVGGTVRIAFVVNPDGQPVDVRVLSTPNSSFNAPTVRAVSLLRFTPAQVQGRPVAVRVEHPITWRVEEAVGNGVAQSGAGSTAVPGDSINGYELSAVEVVPSLRNRDVFRAGTGFRVPSASPQRGPAGHGAGAFPC